MKTSDPRPLLIVGAGGHALSCIDVIEETQIFQIVGLIGVQSEVGKKIHNYSVLGTDLDIPEIKKKYSVSHALIAVGQIKNSENRERLFRTLKDFLFELPTIASPHAYVSKRASIAEGSIVMHGATVNAGVKIGKNCIINSHALLEHDVIVQDHCHISTASTLNGSVGIGHGTFIGSASVIKEGIQIGPNCVIGMNSCVLKDVPEGYTYIEGSKT